ncbi:DUF5011 domain-containing protein [Limosilactobacillus caecicola]|uniref:DUF5011 domain-containing protein n=1 Tax=Limosilactobacillus caecicola TaxID=2941332 RepID=UPI0020421A4B|nr:DUF5011 domain-containing protein [Limosilactobacillus caecicola]
MENQLRIQLRQSQVDWPLGKAIDDRELKNAFGVQVVNQQGQAVNADVIVMTKAVNVTQAGDYQVTFVAEDDQGNVVKSQGTVHVAQLRSQATQTNVQGTKPNNHRQKWLILAIIVVLIICCIFGIRSCQNRQAQQANNASQSSQISENSSSISSLKGDNATLAQQVAALRGAVKQYQQDHDQQALQNQLSHIEQQNEQLRSGLSQNNQTRLNQVTQAAQNIAQNPDNADSEIQKLKNNGFGQLWNSISSQVQQWLNNH